MTTTTLTVDAAKAAKKAARRVPQTFMEAAADFERSKLDELKSSRKLAWIVALTGIGIAALAVAALLANVLVHKDPPPVVLEHDRVTGATTMLRPLKDSADKYDEVTDKYWIRTYVLQRESYDWYALSEQFEATKLMSAPDVASEYAKNAQAKTAPLNILKDKAKITAKVLSIAFVGDLAQVRFTTERVNTGGENLDGAPVQSWIATLGYKFDAGLMTEQQRLVNPLGFKVVTYRVDPEVMK
jgi:type IV secretion system protein VirB8